METLNNQELEVVSGGIAPLLAVGYALTAIGVTDLAIDFVNGVIDGYRDAQ